MSDDIERVARAICTADELDPDTPFGEHKAPMWIAYEGKARAAMEAMSIVTAERIIAAEKSRKFYSDN